MVTKKYCIVWMILITCSMKGMENDNNNNKLVTTYYYNPSTRNVEVFNITEETESIKSEYEDNDIENLENTHKKSISRNQKKLTVNTKNDTIEEFLNNIVDKNSPSYNKNTYDMLDKIKSAKGSKKILQELQNTLGENGFNDFTSNENFDASNYIKNPYTKKLINLLHNDTERILKALKKDTNLASVISPNSPQKNFVINFE